jgi:hypothetical protein
MKTTTYPIPQGCTSVTVEQDGETVIVKFEIEPKRWRAKLYESYFWIKNDVSVCTEEDLRWECDTTRYALGNYFKTADEAKSELDKRANEAV